MADDMRRPNPQPMMRPDGMSSQGGAMMAQPAAKSKLPWIILGVIVVVLLVFGVLFRDKLFSSESTDAAVQGVTTAKASDYQAVFLTNGQVYFGKISSTSDDYITLKDIYYLQVSPAQGSATPGQPPAQQSQLQLVKLGNELHGPVDEMMISRLQVLFYEDIKEDGRVMQAIRCYQKDPSGKTCGDQTQTQPQSQAPAGQSNVNGASTGATPTGNTGR